MVQLSSQSVTKFKRRIRKFNGERLVSIPPEIEGIFGFGQPINVIFDGKKITIEERS